VVSVVGGDAAVFLTHNDLGSCARVPLCSGSLSFAFPFLSFSWQDFGLGGAGQRKSGYGHYR
jgi:hypothetical protein